MHAPQRACIAGGGCAAMAVSAGSPAAGPSSTLTPPVLGQGGGGKARGLATAGTEQAAHGCPHVGGQSEYNGAGQRPEGKVEGQAHDLTSGNRSDSPPAGICRSFRTFDCVGARAGVTSLWPSPQIPGVCLPDHRSRVGANSINDVVDSVQATFDECSGHVEEPRLVTRLCA